MSIDVGILAQGAGQNYLTANKGGGLGSARDAQHKYVIHTNHKLTDRIGPPDSNTGLIWEKFTLEKQSDGTYAIKTADGHYLTAVNGGGVNPAVDGIDAVHTDATRIGPPDPNTGRIWQKFNLVPVQPPSAFCYNIQTIDGYFLTADNGGTPGGANDSSPHDPIRSDSVDGQLPEAQFIFIATL